MVQEVLESWHRQRSWEARGSPAETERHRLRVWGPLPERPSQNGEFVMIARRTGDRDGWWVAPETEVTGQVSG
jgi:hypothetical protein